MKSSLPDSDVSLPQRPAELQDWLNARLYHPLAGGLALALQHTRVTPNMVSAAGFISLCFAALIYGGAMYGAAGPAMAALGLSIHMTWHVLDGADGDLARLTGRASAMGEVVDGLSDYAGHLVLYVALGFALSDQIGMLAWGLAAAAGIARIAQAIFFETHRRQYQSWVYGQSWLGAQGAERPAGILGGLAGIYTTLARWIAAGSERIGPSLERMDKADRANSIERLKAAYKPFLARLSILSANYRTLALGASMLAGTPLYFFIAEAVVLSVFAVVLWFHARRTHGRIADQLVAKISR